MSQQRAITPYLVVQDAPAVIDFVERTFGAGQRHRSIGSAGGLHCEVAIGDTVVMIGGGGAGLNWEGEPMPQALHVYVEDVDAAFARAVAAGGTAAMEPTDHDYGERSAGIRDAGGNQWYIATALGDRHVPDGLHTVNPYLHPLRADPVIAFLQRAFGGRVLERHATPEGAVVHAAVAVGDAVVEMGEAHGPYQPMPSMFVVLVPDAHEAYRRALDAGAASLSEPTKAEGAPFSAAVQDPFGNQWYLARQPGKKG